MPPRLTLAEVYGGGLPFEETFREIMLAWISIVETKDRGESENI